MCVTLDINAVVHLRRIWYHIVFARTEKLLSFSTACACNCQLQIRSVPVVTPFIGIISCVVFTAVNIYMLIGQVNDC